MLYCVKIANQLGSLYDKSKQIKTKKNHTFSYTDAVLNFSFGL